MVESKNNANATHPMVDWKEHASKIKNSLKSQNLLQAKQEVQYALEIYSNHLNLLTIASDVYRALGDREKSLEYAELLITHHPDQWQGYGRAAKDLVALTKVNSSRFYSISESQDKIKLGLEKFPHQLNLLIIASDVYRASGDLEKSLDYAELLITHHPDQRFGYIRSAQNLVALKQFEEARAKVQTGLEKFPNQINLLKMSEKISS